MTRPGSVERARYVVLCYNRDADEIFFYSVMAHDAPEAQERIASLSEEIIHAEAFPVSLWEQITKRLLKDQWDYDATGRDLHARFLYHGFELVGTGGGCTALVRENGDLTRHMVTLEGGTRAPTDLGDLCWYGHIKDGEDVDLTGNTEDLSHEEIHADALLERLAKEPRP